MKRSVPQERFKVATINVIEISDSNIIGITSYLDTPAGVKAAENLFRDIIIEDNPIMVEDDSIETLIDNCITDRFYQDGCYEVLLTHSRR
jgi:hypothetical protein